MKNQQIVLVRRPDGMASPEDFSLKIEDTQAIDKDQFLVKNQYISLDPAMRGWMNAGTTYMPGVQIGSVMR